MTRVLLAQTDPSTSEPLTRALRHEDYDVEVCEGGQDVLDLADERIDVVLLDIDLATVDSLEVCRRLRSRGESMPILILSTHTEEGDVVGGLDSGADDYVAKPVRLGELLARMRAHLRRSAGPDGEVLRLDDDGRRFYLHGAEVRLTGKEFAVLSVLFRERGKVVSREQLMHEVWDPAWFGSTKTLDMHVSVLRRKLRDGPNRYIATVRGVGFRLDVPR